MRLHQLLVDLSTLLMHLTRLQVNHNNTFIGDRKETKGPYATTKIINSHGMNAQLRTRPQTTKDSEEKTGTSGI